MAPVIKFLKKFFYNKILPALRNTTTKRLMIGFGFFLISTSILSLDFVPERVEIEVGQPSPKTIKANKTVNFEDKEKTAELRQKAAAAVNRIHEQNPGIQDQVKAEINSVMGKIKSINANTQVKPQARAGLLKDSIPFKLPDGIYLSLANFNSNTIQIIDTQAKDIVKDALDKGILQENLKQTKETLKKEEVAELELTKDAKIFIGALIDYYLKPNYFYNAKATEEKMEAAMDAVAPVRVTIQMGEKIIGEGEIAKPEHLQKLAALGLLEAPVPVSAVIGIALLVALGMTVVMVYLYQHRNDIYQNEGILILVSLIVIFALLLAKTVMAIEIRGEWASIMGYLVPVAAASMLMAILVDKKLALLVTAIMSGMVGIISGNELRFAMVGLIAGLVAVYSVSKLSQRSDLAKAGLVYVSSANIIAIISVELVTRGFNTAALAAGILLGLLNGVFSAVLTIGILPYLESAFGITSSVKLLELANPGHPLLKRLLIEAPGTYHHSILVGNLAEAAADAVGGDSLLVRVGAYYHDIGKLRRPYFFIENQLSMENPHDKLTPNLSTLIITSHTEDGAELAHEHKLPKPVVDLITQHHGTSLVSFFFGLALENDKNEKTINEEDFRYSGPKPQTKEAALVMMADSVEAAVRALQKPTPGRIEGLVRRVIKEKLHDGQLDECDLTFKDLDIIANAFVRVLSGIFHNRVEYPETVIKEIERRKARDASVRKQPAEKGEARQQAT